MLSDFIVTATFVNPYSASTHAWDYGFIVRHSGIGHSTRYIHLAVTGRGRWEVAWRQGSTGDNQTIAEGRLGRFDTSAGGGNRLWLAAFGGWGLLFVNGEFVSLMDLSPVAGAGDVAVITGAFTGDEVAGAVTPFEGFQIFPLHLGYGPESGNLENKGEFISEHSSTVWTQNLVAEATFSSPAGSDWDYGFSIRNPELNRLDVVVVTANNRWVHDTLDVGYDEYITMDGGRLISPLQSTNHLLLLAVEDYGLFLVNGEVVAELDLSHNLDHGDVSALGGFYRDHTGEPSFENFNVWTIR